MSESVTVSFSDCALVARGTATGTCPGSARAGIPGGRASKVEDGLDSDSSPVPDCQCNPLPGAIEIRIKLPVKSGLGKVFFLD